MFNPHKIKPVGSPLIQSIWRSWNNLKPYLKINPRRNKDAGVRGKDSICWSCNDVPPIKVSEIQKALKIHKKGLRNWEDLWDYNSNDWKVAEEVHDEFRLNETDINLIAQRLTEWTPENKWKVGVRCNISPNSFTWSNNNPLLPIPRYLKDPPIHTQLNKRWEVIWDMKQWHFKLFTIWSKHISPKKACLLWLIYHRGVWTNQRAAKIGKGNGICTRCLIAIEDLHHLFFSCRFNRPIFSFSCSKGGLFLLQVC